MFVHFAELLLATRCNRMDADAVVNNFQVRVETLLDMKPEADIILCSDDARLLQGFNAGVILVRNTEWSVEFLSRWLDSINDSGFAWRHPCKSTECNSRSLPKVEV